MTIAPASPVSTPSDSSVVVLKTRSGKIKTTAQTLADCRCDLFDAFLAGRWTPKVDGKGRPKLRLDFDHKVFKHTLTRMQTGAASTPASFDAALIVEQQRQLDFLGHRPTLGTEAPPLAPEQHAAVQEAIDLRSAVTTPADFVRIEAGEFTMSEPATKSGWNYRQKGDRAAQQRRVELTRPFWIQATPVTQRQWRDLMGCNPSNFTQDGPCGELALDRPVERVSWCEAAAYCNALSLKEDLPTYYDLSEARGKAGFHGYEPPYTVWTKPDGLYGYRLPSEAEQQRARRGSDPATATDPTYAPLNSIAWHRHSGGYRTHPVGLLPPTNEGLYDGLGNVSEWGNDYYAADLPPGDDGRLVDPQGPATGEFRVHSGGDYLTSPSDLRSDLRDYAKQATRLKLVGFRPARFLPLDPEERRRLARHKARQSAPEVKAALEAERAALEEAQLALEAEQAARGARFEPVPCVAYLGAS